MLSFWTFSDVFEEGGPIPTPFEGHFGLRAEGGINKPSYYDFALLHTLAGQRLSNPSHNVIVTRRADGTLVIALWNLVDPDKQGSPRTYTLNFTHLPPHANRTMRLVDEAHSNTLAAYKALGSPVYPTEEQVEKMNAATKLEAPEPLRLNGNELTLQLGVNALAVLELH